MNLCRRMRINVIVREGRAPTMGDSTYFQRKKYNELNLDYMVYIFLNIHICIMG